VKEKKSILIVEDQPLLEKTIQHLLSLWGYLPYSARTGGAAIEVARRESLDLILLDNTLPDMTAFHLLKRLKKELFLAHVPIILLIEKKGFRRELMQKGAIPDDYLIKPADPLDLRLRIEMVLHRTEYQLQANPLTRLPGSIAIEKEVERRLALGQKVSICYLDIDHFKSFNDAYGYQRGNAVLQQTARLVSYVLRAHGNEFDFLGHIGGDDFVVLTTPEKEEDLALSIIQEFDRLIPLHYRTEDLQKGYLSVKNRMGKVQRFPTMTLSIAIVNNKKRPLEGPLHVSELAIEIKKFLKSRKESQSAYFIDRRSGEPKGKEARVEDEPPSFSIPSSKKLHKPLGQLLLESKLIDSRKLDEILAKHWRSGRRLGQILLEENLVDAEALGKLIATQLGVPYVNVRQYPYQKELNEGLPEEWLKEHGVFPMEREGKSLSLAMVNPLDQKIIEWVEKKTGCQVRPCLTMEKEVEKHLEKMTPPPSNG